MTEIQAEKIKQLRKEKAYSQEKLAQKSGLGLRTIQRIEKGNSKARGETLRLLAEALAVEIKDLIEEENTSEKPKKTEDNYSGYLLALHLAPISVLVFPFLNVLVPWVLWIAKKNESENVNQEGKKVLNFQLTLALIFILIFLGSIILMTLKMRGLHLNPSDVSFFTSGFDPMKTVLYLYAFGGFLYAYLICFSIINAIKISKQKMTKYFPVLRFLKP